MADPQDRTPYADALRAYAARDLARHTTPGHQFDEYAQPHLVEVLGEQALALDLQPTIDGIDHGPGNPLEQSLALAAQAWGARRAWFLTNGSTQGNQTACLALAGLGRTIVAQRSVHSSVVDGLALSGLVAEFVAPSVDDALGIAHGVTADTLDRVLALHPDAIAAYLVSPSYFGAVADIVNLAWVAHAHGAALVVDEAWGAHLGFHPALPLNAVRLGADLVVTSVHKMGGSLSQTAVLELGHGPLAVRLEPYVDRAFRALQSTSVYSGLLASLDIARRQAAVHGVARIGASIAAADRLRARIRDDGRFRDVTERVLAQLDVVAVDPLHVVIDTRSGGIGGHRARAVLFGELGHHVEMATDDVIVVLVGAGAEPDVEALADALLRLPHDSAGESAGDSADGSAGERRRIALPVPGRRAMTVREAWFAPSEVVAAGKAVGRVSADTVAAYPPGIPNLMPGEEITAQTLDFLRAVATAPFGHVRGALTQDVSLVRVVRRPADAQPRTRVGR